MTYLFLSLTLAKVEVKNCNISHAIRRLRAMVRNEGVLYAVRRKRHFLTRAEAKNFERREKRNERRREAAYRKQLSAGGEVMERLHTALERSHKLLQSVSPFPKDDGIELHKRQQVQQEGY